MNSLPDVGEFQGFDIAVDQTPRVRLWVTGPDRAKFLHNVCTQDIKGMPPGSNREAFVTSLQGKTLAYVSVHALPDALLVRTDAGVLPQIMPHFQKYGMFDDVVLEDRTESTREWHFAGEQALGLLKSAGIQPPEGVDATLVSVVGGEPFVLIREAPFGIPGWTVISLEGKDDPWIKALDQACLRVTSEQLEGLRILAGIPRNGQDVTPANLPQELDRNDKTISFRKGCYLGQETVARLDALGHVNKILRILSLQGTHRPAIGAVVRSGERDAGAITSVGVLPAGQVVALAMLKVNLAPVGAQLQVTEGDRTIEATVHEIAGR